MGSNIGGSKQFSNIAHFTSITSLDTSVSSETIEIEPMQGHAVIIDAIHATMRGLAGEESSTQVFGIVSTDENQAVVDVDDERTIWDFIFEKDRTTTGISIAVPTDLRNFDRGLPTTSRALRLLVQSDNATLATHQFNCDVEYHYEPLSKAMMLQRGLI